MKKHPFDRCDYLLPPGCKDLIDVLRLNEVTGTTFPGQKSFRVVKKPAQKKPPIIHLPSRVVVKDLAIILGAKLYKLISLLKQMNVFTSVNQKVPFHVASKIARRHGYVVERKGF